MTDSRHFDPVEAFVEAARDPACELPFRLTGVMFQYYAVCERELWFLSRHVEIDRNTPEIVRGTTVDEQSYAEKRRQVKIDGVVAIDLLETGRVVEVKPSSTLVEPARLQLLYYLWYLDRVKDVRKTGVLAHPTERNREEVELDESAREKVEAAIVGIYETISSDSPPPAEEKPVCDSCAYHDFCWSC